MALRGATTSGAWPATSFGRGARPADIWTRLHRVFQVVTTRHMLAEMDDRMLADIGISRSQAATEANRKPWDTAWKPFQR